MGRVPLNNAQPGTPGTLQLALSNGHSCGGTLGITGESCVGGPAVLNVAALPASVQPHLPPGRLTDATGIFGQTWLDSMGGVCLTRSDTGRAV